MPFVIRLLVNAAALWVATEVVPGVSYNGGIAPFLGVALIFGLVNATLGPITKVLTCPLILLTLGLFALVVNGLMLWLTSSLSQSFGYSVVGGESYGNTRLGVVAMQVHAVAFDGTKHATEPLPPLMGDRHVDLHEMAGITFDLSSPLMTSETSIGLSVAEILMLPITLPASAGRPSSRANS